MLAILSLLNNNKFSLHTSNILVYHHITYEPHYYSYSLYNYWGFGRYPLSYILKTKD
jgi:hypothetical protein